MKKYPTIVSVAVLERAIVVLRRKHGICSAYPKPGSGDTRLNRGTPYLSRSLFIAHFNGDNEGYGSMVEDLYQFGTLAEMYCFVCKIIARLTREQWSEKKRNEVH